MKKSILIFLFAFLTIGYLSSCKKCSTCTAKDSNGNEVGSSGEMCEKNKDELEKAESAYKTATAVNGVVVTCQDK